MKKVYTVVITEVLQRKVTVKAESEEEAQYIVETEHYGQLYVLNETDLTEQSFKVKAV